MDLSSLFSELNTHHFRAELPLPLLCWNSRLTTTAGRFTPGSRNPFRPRAPQIEVAGYLLELSGGEAHVRDTLLHEMVHYLLWHRRRPYGHTAEFHQILKAVGASRYNPVPQLRPVKYWYECPHCLVRTPARRELGDVACADCCQKLAGGRYSARFRLAKLPAGAGPSHAPVPVKELPPPIPFGELVDRLSELRAIVREAELRSLHKSGN